MPGATLTTNRLLIYGAVSTGLAAMAVYTTLSTHSNFYSAVVHLSKSNGSILTLANFVLFVSVLVAKVMQLVFFGPLRASEVERLYDRTWYFLTESLLAFTIFRDDFDAAFVCLFGGLLFIKSFHWILADRVEAMDQQPYPGPPKLFHIRTIALFNLLAIADIVMIASIAEIILHEGVDGLVLFLSEYTILLASLLNSWLKYIISVYDIYRASSRGGEEAPPWENKSMYIFYVELLADFLKLSTYLTFFLTVLTYYGLPLNIIRDVFLTARSFVGRVRDLMRYRAATRDMDHRYPDALPAEMEALEDRTCIICREEMVSGGVAGAGAVAGGPNTTPKKLPCGHIFHFHCLRSWLERQQSCPTCRRTVLESGRPAANTANANGNANAAGGQNQQGAIAIFNRVWNGPGQAQPPPPVNGVPPQVPPAAGAPPPPFAPGPMGNPAFPWGAGVQPNHNPWMPMPPPQFQGFNAGGQWYPWGAPPAPGNERNQEQRQQPDLTPTGSTGTISGAGLVASPAALDRDATPMQLNHPISGPAPPAPTPVQKVVPVPNKTPPEAKGEAIASPGAGSSTGTTPREAAALAALRRFQAGRSTESLRSPPAANVKAVSSSLPGTPLPPAPGSGDQRANTRSPLAETSPRPLSPTRTTGAATGPGAGAGTGFIPNLIPLYNPASVPAANGSSGAAPSPYFADATPTPVTPLINPTPPTQPQSAARHQPTGFDFAFGGTQSRPQTQSQPNGLPRSGQLPAAMSESQLANLDRLTREAIDERLRVLEGVQTTVWRCVEELTRLRSALPEIGSGGTRHESVGSAASGSVGSSFGVEIERSIGLGGTSAGGSGSGGVPEINIESGGENEVDGVGKGKGKERAESDELDNR
ncbi:E3 ubiquitin-protein ligase synoviolin [Ceratobasidium sp. AG-Ba]|nr:E3 ubiquitin-protein ligase synoviolin [Ceratobasidium sp. AG-Ba]